MSQSDHQWILPDDDAQYCGRCKRYEYLTPKDEECDYVPEATITNQGNDGMAVIIVHDAEEAGKLMSSTDRCDRCDAQAYVVCLTMGTPYLQLCAHHYREHEAGLVRVMFMIHDCRSLLPS